jgi:protein-disulfide isomerase
MSGRIRILTVSLAITGLVAGAGCTAESRSSQDLPAGARISDAPKPAALTDAQRAQFITWYEAQPKVNVPIDTDGAKLLIVEFSDYQCSFCRQAYYEYKPLLARYTATGQVKFVLKHFPLEKECNPSMQGDLHVSACEAAAAVVMAQMKGTGDKLEAWLFANQSSLTPATIKTAAADIGGVKDYDAQYSRALMLVTTDAGLGRMLGAKSTPTLIINGRLISGLLPIAQFQAAIDYELKGSK